MSLRTLIQLILLLALGACASGHYRTSAELRKMVVAGNFDGAILYLNESSLAKDEKSKLLYHFELGLLQHYKGDHLSSAASLNRARELVDELYTTRVSGKLGSALSNDNADFYYGEKYEASLVFFYQSLNFYMLAQVEPDAVKRKEFLEKARAEVVAWDSFLTEMKVDRLGKALFKEDLLAKTFGALVHESQGNAKDNQIALQLYKDAREVFFKNYNLFPTFNSAYEKFRQDFNNLPGMKKEEIEGKYVLATDHSNSLKDFLDLKIKQLSTRSSKKSSISFLVQDGLIAEKSPQKYQFPMYWGAHESQALTMGLGSHMTFELPMVREVQELEPSRLEALSPQGVVLHQGTLTVVAPLSELAQQAINEHAASIATRTAARVAGKHLAAMLASAAAYNMARQRNDSLAMILATAGHAAAVAAINQSEKADVRFWSTLPSNIRMGHISVPAGTYSFRAVFAKPGATEYRVIELGVHEVKDGTQKFVHNSKVRSDLPGIRKEENVIQLTERIPASAQ